MAQQLPKCTSKIAYDWLLTKSVPIPISLEDGEFVDNAPYMLFDYTKAELRAISLVTKGLNSGQLSQDDLTLLNIECVPVQHQDTSESK